MRTSDKRGSVRKQDDIEKSSSTRKALIATAQSIFHEKLFSQSTVSEIVERADVYDRAVTYHFADKQALFMAVVERAVREGTEKLIDALPNDPRKRLDTSAIVRRLLPLYLDFYAENATLVQSLRDEFPARSVAALIEQSDAEVIELVARTLRNGTRRNHLDPRFAAAVVVRATHSAARGVFAGPAMGMDRNALRLGTLRIFGIGEPRPGDLLDRAKRAGLKPLLVSLLLLVRRTPNATVSELESGLGGSRRSVQRYLRELVDQGFIWEVGTSPTDPSKIYELL